MKYLLIGQPNAGKSSIYNKLSEAENIIHKVEGTTRDWHSSRIKGLNYSVIYDSPGVIINDNKSTKSVSQKSYLMLIFFCMLLI